jgi:hypothetical protein
LHLGGGGAAASDFHILPDASGAAVDPNVLSNLLDVGVVIAGYEVTEPVSNVVAVDLDATPSADDIPASMIRCAAAAAVTARPEHRTGFNPVVDR